MVGEEMREELAQATLKDAARGDTKAFKRMYDHYAPYVWRVAYRMVDGDSLVARQIVQDVFVRAYRGMRKFNYRASFSTWLYRIAYNQGLTLLSRQRRERSRTMELREETVGVEYAGRIEARDEVSRILGQLSPEERFILVMREVEGIPFDELAELTGRTSGALRTQLSRIKDALRQEIDFGNGS